MPNYDPNGRRLKDCVFSDGLDGKIFVDPTYKHLPYIVLSPPSGDGNVQIRYVSKGSNGTLSKIPLSEHLDDPKYDFEVARRSCHPNGMVDEEKLRLFRLMAIG